MLLVGSLVCIYVTESMKFNSTAFKYRIELKLDTLIKDRWQYNNLTTLSDYPDEDLYDIEELKCLA